MSVVNNPISKRINNSLINSLNYFNGENPPDEAWSELRVRPSRESTKPSKLLLKTPPNAATNSEKMNNETFVVGNTPPFIQQHFQQPYFQPQQLPSYQYYTQTPPPIVQNNDTLNTVLASMVQDNRERNEYLMNDTKSIKTNVELLLNYIMNLEASDDGDDDDGAVIASKKYKTKNPKFTRSRKHRMNRPDRPIIKNEKIFKPKRIKREFFADDSDDSDDSDNMSSSMISNKGKMIGFFDDSHRDSTAGPHGDHDSLGRVTPILPYPIAKSTVLADLTSAASRLDPHIDFDESTFGVPSKLPKIKSELISPKKGTSLIDSSSDSDTLRIPLKDSASSRFVKPPPGLDVPLPRIEAKSMRPYYELDDNIIINFSLVELENQLVFINYKTNIKTDAKKKLYDAMKTQSTFDGTDNTYKKVSLESFLPTVRTLYSIADIDATFIATHKSEIINFIKSIVSSEFGQKKVEEGIRNVDFLVQFELEAFGYNREMLVRCLKSYFNRKLARSTYSTEELTIMGLLMSMFYNITY